MSQSDIAELSFILFVITIAWTIFIDWAHRQKFKEAMKANEDALKRGDDWMRIAQHKQKTIWSLAKDIGFLHKEVLGLSAVLSAKSQKIEDLIFKIWGSRTIPRELRDVGNLIDQLYRDIERLQISNKGLAVLVEHHNREIIILQAEGRSARTMADQHEATARFNAGLLMALMKNKWAIIECDCEFLVCDTQNNMRTLRSGISPESAITGAAQELEEA